MTEKNAAFGNNFTPEQRSAALKRATEMRAARAEYLGRVKSGEVSIADALEAGKGDPVVGRIRPSGCSWRCRASARRRRRAP